MRVQEGRPSRKSTIGKGVKDFRERRFHRSHEQEDEDEDRLDLYFLAGWLCVGGIAYFAFVVLKGFIAQGVM